MRFRHLISGLLLILVLAVGRGQAEPITGAAFDSLMAAQDTACLNALESLFGDAVGCFVTGPLDPLLVDRSDPLAALFSSPRVVCSTIRRFEEQWTLIADRKESVRFAESPRMVNIRLVSGNRLGMFIEVNCAGEWKLAQLGTANHMRHLIWLRRAILNGWNDQNQNDRIAYSKHIYRYFKWLEFSRHMYINATEFGSEDKTPPLAVDYHLPERFDLFAEPPDYVIQGYQNYKDYLSSHAELTTDFATGITAFVPTVETLEWMKQNAPREAYPNKEAAKLQEEYREFFERGGDPRVMQTLTSRGYDTLATGEYFFAVGLNGTIRFGREMLREEVERIEKGTWRKVPRANHAFLFPGEPVLTAGAFFIDERTENKLVKVNAQSGHYFYSNISTTIREDIAERSDHYLLTLGHFFNSLDRLGIEYDGILISKL